MMRHRLAPLLLVLALSPGVSAHEPEQEAVVKTYTAALSPDHQVVGTVHVSAGYGAPLSPLPAAYGQQIKAVCERRAALAGYRLAALLKDLM